MEAMGELNVALRDVLGSGELTLKFCYDDGGNKAREACGRLLDNDRGSVGLGERGA